MSGQQAFFTSDTALVREPRERVAHTARASEVSNATANTTGNTLTGNTISGKSLAERLVAAWLAPWSPRVYASLVTNKRRKVGDIPPDLAASKTPQPAVYDAAASSYSTSAV